MQREEKAQKIVDGIAEHANRYEVEILDASKISTSF